MNIKDLVKDGKKVKFSFYQKGELWYETDCGFKFAVPIEDTGDGRFQEEEKAMLLMRYIRKQIAKNDAGERGVEYVEESKGFIGCDQRPAGLNKLLADHKNACKYDFDLDVDLGPILEYVQNLEHANSELEQDKVKLSNGLN